MRILTRQNKRASSRMLSTERLESRVLLCHGGRPPHTGCGGDDPPPDPPPLADPAIVFIARTSKGLETTDELMVMNADGSNQSGLLTADSNDVRGLTFPAMSPDLDGDSSNGYQGTIAVESQPALGSPTGLSSIILVDLRIVDGVPTATNERILVDENDANVGSVVAKPDWSPDLDANLPGYQGEVVFTTIASINVVKVNWNESTAEPTVVRDPGSSQIVYQANSPQSVTFPDWSPDGSNIAFRSRNGTDDYELLVINRADAETPPAPTTSLVRADAIGGRLQWSRTGDQIAYVRPLGRTSSGLFAVDVAAPHNERMIHQGVDSPNWSPDDPATPEVETDQFLVASSGGAIVRVDLSDGAETVLAEAKKTSFRWPAWRETPSSGWAPAANLQSVAAAIEVDHVMEEMEKNSKVRKGSTWHAQ